MDVNRSEASLLLLAVAATAVGASQHHSSNWWSRMIETPIHRNFDMPVNRRSHSATVYRQAASEAGTGEDIGMREWMIVSGGFTDLDWEEFPVWAYDLTNSRSFDDVREEFSAKDSAAPRNDTAQNKFKSAVSEEAPWMDLTGFNTGAVGSPEDAVQVEDNKSLLKNMTAAGPKGRVGHLSSVYKDCLYIFGGLTYSLGSFHVENDDSDDGADKDEKNTMIVWRACGLSGLFSDDERQQGLDESNQTIGLLHWERIVPRVDTNFPVSNDVKSENSSGDRSSHRSTAADTAPNDDLSALVQEQVPKMLSRGESQGGHFTPTHGMSSGDSYIIYGGMHRHHTSVLENGANSPSANNEVPLGDVWKYDYETETFSLLAPYPPLDWQRDKTTTKTFPTARTSHAGTVVGDKLIIHGGMGSYDDQKHTEKNFADHATSSYSSSYATYKTSPKWIPLADTWEFDLVTLKWKERMQYPQLARSYHSLVGWQDGRVAAFGGFQQDNSIGGETVAFVFKDLIVSKANEAHWLKLRSPYSQVANWQTYHYKSRTGISNRLEHTAVLDQYGSMYIWGGRFKSVHEISGLWRLDVFNHDTKLEYELAQPDGIEQYEAELEALHMFIAIMMFVSLAMSSFFSMLQQRRARETAEDGNTGSILPRRRGLTRRVIESLPVKHYDATSAENNESDSAESDCCPICLVEYEQGSEIRSLPCGHEFCRACIDPWLEEHTSCPACRARVENVPLDQPSWAVSLGRVYNPNRRNQRYNFRRERQQLDPVDTDSTQDETDEWYDQTTTPSMIRWFNPMRYLRRAENAGHAAVPNDDITSESVELV